MSTDELLSIGLEVAAFHIAGVIAAGHAIMYTRTSQGAIAWAVALVSVPYLTLIPYFFLGSSRFAGYVDEQRFNRARAEARSASSDQVPSLSPSLRLDAATDPRLRRFRAIERLVGRTFLRGNRVRLLRNGADTFDTILAAVGQAQHYVMVQFFIVRDDALGEALSDALIERARAGVKVFFLYDGIGSHGLARAYIRRLRAAGVQVHAFAVRRFRNRFQLNFRNHRKIVVVDGQTAFIGGHNVGQEYIDGRPPLAPWRDTHIQVDGPAVAQIQRTFSEDWFWVTDQVLAVRLPAAQPEDMACLAVPSGPADLQETCALFFVQAIHAAQQRVWIASPYFVPDSAVQSALRLAVLRGVDVRLLIPGRPDHFMVYQASRLYACEAMRAGVKVYRYGPGFTHQKVVLIDDDTAAVGSANLDNRSFRLNFEIMLLTVCPAFAARTEAMLVEDFAHARQMAPDEYARLPLVQRVLMHVARLFSPIL